MGKFVEAVNTTGGHILILLSLIGLGAWMVVHNIVKGEDLFVGSFAALLAILVPKSPANAA